MFGGILEKIVGKNKNKVEFNCENCGKIAVKYKYNFEKSVHNFCCQDCFFAWKAKNRVLLFDGVRGTSHLAKIYRLAEMRRKLVVESEGV